MRWDYEAQKFIEQSTLASIKNSTTAAKMAFAALEQDDFVAAENGVVFAAMKQISTEGSDYTDITLIDNKIKDSREYDAAGGFQYLVEVFASQSFSLVPEENIVTIKNVGREKRLVDSIVRMASSDEDVLPKLEVLVETEKQRIRPITSSGMKLAEQIEEFLQDLQNPDPRRKIAMGYPTIDRLTGGLTKRSLALLGGRPGHGKTDIMIDCAQYSARSGHKTAVFSLEMSTGELLERYAALLAGINYTKIHNRKGYTSEEIVKASMELSELPAGNRLSLIDDVFTINGIVSEITRIRPSVVWIDYVQIIEPERHYQNARRREIAEITTALKRAAKRYDCAICILSQLNRDATERAPTKEDLAECDALAQQSDLIMLIHRPPFHNKEKDVGAHRADFIIDKNKYGACIRQKMNFDGGRQRFTESYER